MSRRMPIPQNDPKERGKRRSDKVDIDPNILKSELEKQQQEDSTDEEANWVNIRRILRAIPRNNPNDPFKPHSEVAIRRLAENSQHGQHPLLPEEEKLLQHYGYDLDVCTIYDKPNPGIHKPFIPNDHQYILNRFPAWLRCYIENRYREISKKYGDKTLAFLKSLARTLDLQKTKHLNLAGEPFREVEDVTNYLDIEDDDHLLGDDVALDEQEMKRQNKGLQMDLDPFRPVSDTDEKDKVKSKTELKIKDGEDKVKSKTKLQIKDDEDKVKSKTKLEVKDDEDEETMKRHHLQLWSPVLLQKAGDALRAALVAGASETEDEDYYEEGADEIIYKQERKKGNVRHKDAEFVYRGAQWEAIVAEESGFHEEAEEMMNEEFMRPDVLKEYRRNKRLEENEKRKAERKAKREMKKAFRTSDGHPLLKRSGENQKDAAIWRERGVGRRPSRIFLKSPCDGPIVEVERSLHQTRSMEAMRAYANWIAASNTFKYFIMIIIIGNAALLALETGESRNTYAYAFETLDSFFLSVYFAEFLLKFFAYPNQYFLSGFNVFDFVILVVSLIKSLADWLNWGDFEYLRFLTIIRALRILRGVSLSIHIQVLVRALLDTLKNHVVSVVLLLILLMYITSIVAFYLYGSVSGLDQLFGSFEEGMLRLFAFVTMDGWTEIMYSFGEVGKLHDGRLFCLLLIVLGNFLFSNIFIAIIIMQISDATDSFRKTRADERDIKVSRKQEEVFRRQKLDMRQLLARQRLGVADDFYELGSRFVRRLRHEDLVDSPDIIFSPLWIDALYKTMQRAHHTSNIIMNQHRKMADRLVRLGNLYDEDRLNVRGISRARYNRYADVRAKLRLLKEQFLTMRDVKSKPRTKVKWQAPAHNQKARSKTKVADFIAEMKAPKEEQVPEPEKVVSDVVQTKKKQKMPASEPEHVDSNVVQTKKKQKMPAPEQEREGVKHVETLARLIKSHDKSKPKRNVKSAASTTALNESKNIQTLHTVSKTNIKGAPPSKSKKKQVK